MATKLFCCLILFQQVIPVFRSWDLAHLKFKDEVEQTFFERKHSIGQPFSAWGDNLQSQILERVDQKKNECLGVLKSTCHRYLPRGLTMFLIKQDFVKWNMALRAQFSNISLGLFQPNNQLMLGGCHVLVLLNHLTNVTKN